MKSEFNLKTLAKILYHFGFSFFYPSICRFCFNEKADKSEGYVGENCRKQISPIEPPLCEICGNMFPGDFEGTQSICCAECRNIKPSFDWARAAVKTGGLPLEAIYKYKYGGALWIEGWLGRLLIEGAEKWLSFDQWDVIVPVPLHPKRKKTRNFNQAERLAEILSKHSGIHLDKSLVQRIRETPSQTRLSRKERIENMSKAFQCDSGRDLTGQRVIIVDDVMTTGATCNAVAQALKKQKASYVFALTLCRGTPLV